MDARTAGAVPRVRDIQVRPYWAVCRTGARPSTRQALCWIMPEILSGDEIARADRFVFDRHRAGTTFSPMRCCAWPCRTMRPEIAPSAWTFAAGRYGRPFVATPLADPLHFSLSHTEGCVTRIISGHEAVGVDPEQVRPRGTMMDIVRGAPRRKRSRRCAACRRGGAPTLLRLLDAEGGLFEGPRVLGCTCRSMVLRCGLCPMASRSASNPRSMTIRRRGALS